MENLQMPKGIPQTEPGQPARLWVFDHVPSLKELLPKYAGLPGYEYAQCCVVNLRHAQDNGWTEVDGTMVYTVQGPKGAVDMKLVARGRRIPGQPPDSGARLCYADKLVQELTGLWINPHLHDDEPEPEAPTPLPTQKRVKTKEVTENAA